MIFMLGIDAMENPCSPDKLSTFRFRRRTPGTFVLVPCPLLGRSIRCQGQLEAAAAVVLAACPQVCDIREQPVQIWYALHDNAPEAEAELLPGRPSGTVRGKARVSYVIPDFLVEMTTGEKRLIEIKPSRKLADAIVARKLSVSRTYALAQGWSFHAITERELFRSALVSNLRLLGRFRQRTADPEAAARLVDMIRRRPFTVRQILTSLAVSMDGMQIRAVLWHLVATRQLDVDPTIGPLSDDTFIHPEGAILWEPFDSVWGPSGSLMDVRSASFVKRGPTNSWHGT